MMKLNNIIKMELIEELNNQMLTPVNDNILQSMVDYIIINEVEVYDYVEETIENYPEMFKSK